MPETGERARCFFAVWPDPAVRDELAAWAGEIDVDGSARPVAPDNIHVTLAFLGPLAPPQVEAAQRIARRIDWRPGVLALDRIGYWKRPGIVWAGARDGCEALSRLAEALRDGLRRSGFRVEAREFVPHVTLFRKARRRPKWQPRTTTWPIDGFCLVQSHLSSNGARYEVLDRWSAPGDVK